MNLYSEFKAFDPKPNKLADLKKQAKDHFEAFLAMDAEHDCFWTYMKLIEEEINYLRYEHAHYVEWIDEFWAHSEKYYNLMAFQVFRKIEILDNRIIGSGSIDYKLINN